MTAPRWFFITVSASAIVIAISLVVLATRPQVGRYVDFGAAGKLLDTATGTLCEWHTRANLALMRGENSCS